MMPKGRKPTPKQLRFCQEYVVNHNATAAYVRAGYSENGASQAAYKLLRNTYILEAVAGERGRRRFAPATAIKRPAKSLSKTLQNLTSRL